MGQWVTRLYEVYQSMGVVSARIVMIGLDNAGKTTVLYKIKLNEIVSTIPTIGFNVETVEPVKGVSFTMWDVGGQDKIRPLWRQYYHRSEGVLYVVDSSDRERVMEAAEELHAVLSEDNLRGVPLVILANKQDLPNAMRADELANALNLRRFTNPWHIQATCAKTGQGLCEALQSLSKLVKEFKNSRASAARHK